MKGLDPLAHQSQTCVTDDSGAGREMKANHIITNTVRMPAHTAQRREGCGARPLIS